MEIDRLLEGISIYEGLLPVSVLWEYREFRRDEIKAPFFPLGGVNVHGLENITGYVFKTGFDYLELSIVNGMALLTDGNHRIVSARRLGFRLIPVVVTVLHGDGSDIFYKSTLTRFRPISKTLRNLLNEIFVSNATHQHC